jgi:hypothetical protein
MKAHEPRKTRMYTDKHRYLLTGMTPMFADGGLNKNAITDPYLFADFKPLREVKKGFDITGGIGKYRGLS